MAIAGVKLSDYNTLIANTCSVQGLHKTFTGDYLNLLTKNDQLPLLLAGRSPEDRVGSILSVIASQKATVSLFQLRSCVLGVTTVSFVRTQG